MSRASLREFMGASAPDDPALIAEGFVPSQRFAGCLVKSTPGGDYVVFRPIDTRSGRWEAYFQTADNRMRNPG